MKIIHVTIIIISTHYSFATIFVYNLWWPFCVLGWIAPTVLRPYDSRVRETVG